MNGNTDFYHWAPVFDDPELGTQQTFRAIVEALDNPGQIVQIRSKPSFPGALNLASAAIFLTLCNDGTTIWADLDWNCPITEWFQYRCGCNIVTEPCMASFALITNPMTMPPLDHFRIGDEENPDISATLIIQIEDLSVNTAINPDGTAVEKIARHSHPVVPLNSWEHRYQQSTPLFLGLDIFLTCDDTLAALPQSIKT